MSSVQPSAVADTKYAGHADQASASTPSAVSLNDIEKKGGGISDSEPVDFPESEGHLVALPGPEPTEEELATLPKVSDRLPFSAFYVVIVELAERFTYYGLSGVFQNYMTVPRDATNQTPGLGLQKPAPVALSNFFQFWCYVTPIPGGIIADMWLGKYNTILIFTLVYIVGNLVLFLTSLPVSIRNGHGEGGLVAAMVIIGLGTGGIKANVSTLIADQYTNTRRWVKTKKNGKKVIVDPDATMQNIFMIFYWAINVGSLSAIATTELEKNVDFWAAYLLPAAFFFIAFVVLLLGRNKYVKRPPAGSPLPHAARIFGQAVANMFKRGGYRSTNSITSAEPVGVKYGFIDRIGRKLTGALGWVFQTFTLDIARPSVRAQLGLPAVPWTDNFVDQVGRALLACKVFVFYPIFWLTYNQMLNNFINQAGTMETHGIPNDIMQNIDPLAIIIFIPIMDYLVYPWLRKAGFPMYPMTRITIGFIFCSLAMAYAAIVQHIIYVSPPCYENAGECAGDLPNKVHVAVQTPSYFLLAMGEIFISITGLEYAYTKAPPTMKSFVMAIYLFTTAIAAALGIALSPTAENPKLVWMYVGLAVAAIVVGILFWLLYSQYNAVEEALNRIDVHEREATATNFGGENDVLHSILHPQRTNLTQRSKTAAPGQFNATENALADSRLNANNF